MNTITHYNDLIRKSLAFPEFRITLDKAGCRFHVVLTQGVRHTVEDMFGLFCKIALFNDFNENNDPYGEHDFLIVQHEGETIYAKFDYYDRQLECERSIGGVHLFYQSFTKQGYNHRNPQESWFATEILNWK